MRPYLSPTYRRTRKPASKNPLVGKSYYKYDTADSIELTSFTTMAFNCRMSKTVSKYHMNYDRTLLNIFLQYGGPLHCKVLGQTTYKHIPSKNPLVIRLGEVIGQRNDFKGQPMKKSSGDHKVDNNFDSNFNMEACSKNKRGLIISVCSSH